MGVLFDGLKGFEIVLLVLGTLLFVVLLLDVGVKIIKQRSFSKTLYGMVLPIVFIGFPSYNRVQVGKDLFSFEKTASEARRNPDDSVAQKKLVQKLNDFDISRVQN